MPACDLADHASHLRAVERRERNDAVVRAHGPGRPEFGPRGGDDQQRGLRAALGEPGHEIERSRIGPVQVLEGENDRLRSAPPPEPRPSSPPVAGAAIPRAGTSPGGPPAAECRPAARAGAHIRPRRGRSASKCSRGRRDAPRRSRRRRQSAVCPIRRAGAGACSAGAARRPIRPRCAASRRALRGIPRSDATCRCRARRRSARTGPRLRARATSGAEAGKVRLPARRAASESARRRAGRRSPARCDRASWGLARP